MLDFSTVDWYFLGAIFVSKTVVFTAAIFLTLITIRPVNVGQAAIFAIFVSQSNDFALGQPIVQAIYQKSHPEYIRYIYLIAPISLVILNPIGFFLLELNEQWNNDKLEKDKEPDRTAISPNIVNSSEGDITQISVVVSEESTNSQSASPDQKVLKTAESTSSFHSYFAFEDNIVITTGPEKARKNSRLKILKKTLLSTISNPIVFMTFLGIVVNFAFKQRIPALIEPILTTLSNSFSAIALFYLGMNMVGRIRNLTFSGVVIIMVLIFSKGLFFPLITREMVVLLGSFKTNPSNMTKSMVLEQNSDLSTFGFLYGTFPSAPSLLAFIGRYKVNYFNFDME